MEVIPEAEVLAAGRTAAALAAEEEASAAAAPPIVGSFMHADQFFSDAEKERIHQAIIAAESKTAGEIVPMIVTSSARYTEIELLGLVVGLFGGIIIEWFWSDPWGSEYLNLWPVIGAFVGFLAGRMPIVKRLVASKDRVTEAVHTLKACLGCTPQWDQPLP